MNTTSFLTQSVFASEVLNTIFSREIRQNPDVLDEMEFSAYEIDCKDTLFIDMLDFFEWLTVHSNDELTLRIYEDGYCELVGDMYLEKNIVLARDTRMHGTLSDLVVL